MTSRRSVSATACVLAALAVTAVTAVPANAQLLGGGCEPADASNPFKPWLDPAHYVLAPGGDLEAGDTPWALEDGAVIVDGNEPYYVSAKTDAASLRLPGGSSATTAPMCVALEHPTLRLFARRTAGPALSTLKVEVLLTDSVLLQHQTLPIGAILSNGRWAPTATFPIVANLVSVTGLPIKVSFRFTAKAGTAWLIDDVYVDPYRTN